MKRIFSTPETIWFYISIVILLSIMLMIASCSKKEKKMGSNTNSGNAKKPAPLLLTWTGFDGKTEKDPEKAHYILDGKVIGTGKDGIYAVLSDLKKNSEHRELYIYPDDGVFTSLAPRNDSALHDTDGRYEGEPFLSVPFRNYNGFNKELLEFGQKYNIKIWYLAKPPGEFVDENGDDLKVEPSFYEIIEINHKNIDK